MNSLEMGANLLAEQSIFAQLSIKPKTPNVSSMQQENDRFFITHPITHKITDANTNNFAISNLSPLIKTLPVNSIFDYILYVRPDLPDFRFVNVDNVEYNVAASMRAPISKNLESLSLHEDSGTVHVHTLFEPAPSTKHASNYNSKYGIFNMSQFDMTKAFPSLYNDVAKLLEPLPVKRPSSNRADNIVNILKAMNINDIAYVNDVIENRETRVTDTAVRVRTVHDLLSSIDDRDVSKLTNDTNKRIAAIIDGLVQNYRA